jgi:hypothetical protein
LADSTQTIAAAGRLSANGAVLAKPPGEGRLVHLARGDGEHGQRCIGLTGNEPPAVERQEQADRKERGALVAIDERRLC